MTTELENAAEALNTLSKIIHQRNVEAGWWNHPITGEDLHGFNEGPEIFSNAKRDILNLLCLIHSEISEACEGVRKNLNDDKIPSRSMLEVELIDCIVRIADLAGAHSLDLGGALLDKLEFNRTREDHKLENRTKPGGKIY